MKPRKGRTLGVHPAHRGFGWVVFEGPFSPVDWGRTDSRRGNEYGVNVANIEKLLDRFEPDTLVLEAFDRRSSVRSHRVARLGRAVVAIAADKGIDVTIFRRGDVKACFASVGAVSRQQIAEAIARHLPPLAHKLPKPRKRWESESSRAALFNAAALVLTHYRYSALQLLDDLKNAAEKDEE